MTFHLDFSWWQKKTFSSIRWRFWKLVFCLYFFQTLNEWPLWHWPVLPMKWLTFTFHPNSSHAISKTKKPKSTLFRRKFCSFFQQNQSRKMSFKTRKAFFVGKRVRKNCPASISSLLVWLFLCVEHFLGFGFSCNINHSLCRFWGRLSVILGLAGGLGWSLVFSK